MASQSSSISAPFTKPLSEWIDMIAECSKSARSQTKLILAIPDLLHDLKSILNLMVHTPVLTLAGQEPRLAHFLASVTTVAAFRAHVYIARALVKCILYIMLGPRSRIQAVDRDEERNHPLVLKWGLEQLSRLRQDAMQSEQRFSENLDSSPQGQVEMMTDLGHERSSLSASLIQHLSSQLASKLDAIDHILLSHPQIINLLQNEPHKDIFSINTLKYCSFRHIISLKCLPLLDNGPFVLQLIQRIITSNTRRILPNTCSTASLSTLTSPAANASNSNNNDLCICGLSNLLVDKLMAHSAFHFGKLDLPARTSLLTQCPRALLLEIERVIRQAVARPFATSTQLQAVTDNLIEASLQSPPVYTHWTQILRQLISASVHPSLIALYSAASEELLSRLQQRNAAKRRLHPLTLYWPSSLTHLLSLPPKSTRQYYAINKSIELIIGTPILEKQEAPQNLTSPQESLSSVWFTILSFRAWIQRAYELIEENCMKGLSAENAEVFKFLAFHAHPASMASRRLAFDELILHYSAINSVNDGANMDDVVKGVLESDPIVHPLLLYLWPNNGDDRRMAVDEPNGASEDQWAKKVVSMAFGSKSPSVTLSSILDFLEPKKALSHQGASSEPNRRQAPNTRAQHLLSSLMTILQDSPTLELADVKSRLSSLSVP